MILTPNYAMSPFFWLSGGPWSCWHSEPPRRMMVKGRP